jgi:hypothetical protein
MDTSLFKKAIVVTAGVLVTLWIAEKLGIK